MYNGRNIIIGLLVFAVLISSPFLLNIGQAQEMPDISLDTPAINAMEKKECVESAEFMRLNHPQLLNDWRDRVVREGQTVYLSSSGQEYEMSLENSCLECHSNQTQFCNTCHTYADVDPYCWDCHNASKGADQ